MRAHFKAGLRLFKKHYIRLLTIMAIVIVSVGFASGIGEVEDKIKTGANELYESQNIHDLYIKSTQINTTGGFSYGFTDEQIEMVKEKYGEENVMESFCMDVQIDSGEYYRIILCDFDKWNINKLELLDGNYPEKAEISGNTLTAQVLTERKTNRMRGFEGGEKINLSIYNLFDLDLTVVGESFNPLMIFQDDELAFVEENQKFYEMHTAFMDNPVYISAAIYINTATLPSTPIFKVNYNDLSVTLPERGFNAYSASYKALIDKNKAEVSEMLGNTVQVQSLYENIGMYMMISYAEKVGQIGIIFVVFFALVTMLVVYSTMSRLLDEERGQIACMKTLGYSDLAILGKYLLFVAVASLVGGAISYGVGLGLTMILYKAFNIQYYMPPFPAFSKYIYYFATYGTIVFVSVLFTLFAGLKLVKQKPVALLARKTPKAGRKVLMEYITFIWKHLSFKYKSSFRNVFLFRSRFYMTVISIMGSTVLVLAGLGLLDNALQMPNAQSIVTISAALIVFSALLCALVIYNITNINVSEREREIATLMVLGYRDMDLIGYIFREIFIMSIIGAVLGIPVGLLFLKLVFGMIDFGTIGNINWWTWILAPVITLIFGAISGALLFKRILHTDMNASLKSLE